MELKNRPAAERRYTPLPTAHLQCVAGYPPWLRECVDVKCRPFSDDGPIPRQLFFEAQDWAAGHWEAGGRVLVSCAAGQSRSVSMAVALLCRMTDLRFVDAAHEVIAAIPLAYPYPHLLASGAAYLGEPLEFEELQAIYDRVRDQHPHPWPDGLLRQALATVKR